MGIRDLIGSVGSAFRPRATLTPQTLEEMLRSMIGAGGETASGAVVTPDSALRTVTVYACVRVLAETLAQVPLIIYRRTIVNGAEGKERATDHPLYRVLHDAPNQFQTSFEFREMMQAHIALRGNAYAIKVRVRDELRELLPIHPDRVTVKQRPDWSLVYTLAMPDGSRMEVPAAAILHLRGLSVDGFMGLNPIAQMREAIGLARETERHGAQFFGNGGKPAGVLTTEKNLKPDQIKQLRDSWQAAQTGENRLKTAILDGGFSYSPISITNEDAQFLETRKFQRAEIASMFRVPPHKVGDLDRATFSNIEHQDLEFVKYTMMPWFRRWESGITAQLIDPRERGEIFAEFLVDGLLRGDSKARAMFYSMALRDGWMNRDEVRGRENMDPIPDGDKYAVAENVYGPDPFNTGQESSSDASANQS